MQKFGAELVLKDSGFSKKISTATNAVKKFKTNTNSGSKSVKKLDGVMQKNKSTVKNWIAGFAGIAAITMGLKSAASTFMEFDDTMRMVGAVAKSTDTELIQLTDTAKKLGATTAWTASQVGQGMKFFGMAGFKTNQIIGAMPGLLSLASASQTDLATASDIVSDALTMFGMKASRTTELADIMTVAATDANTTVTGLGEAYKYVGATSFSMGQGIRQTTAMLQVLANSAQKGAKGGRQLVQVMNTLSKKSKDGRVNIGKYSVSIADAKGNFRDVMDVLSDVGEAVKDLTPVARDQAIGGLFTNPLSRNAAKILIKDIDMYSVKLKAVNNEQGAAKEMSEKMEAGMGGAWRRVKSAAEDVSISMGQMHSPALMTGMELVISTLGGVSRNVGALSQLVASGAITWGLYTGAQKLMVLWTKRQIYWGDILAMRQGGLTMILKSGTLHMALLTAGAYAWINVAKEISDVNTAVGNDTRLMTNSWEDFYLVMAKVGKFVDYTMGRFFHAVGVWNDAEYAILEKIQLKEGYDVQVKIEERSKKAKIGRYDPEWIKEQQKKAKDQMISGEKEINKALNSLKLGNLKKNAGSSATEGKEIVKVIGNKTKFSSAFDMGGNSPDADYSISSRRIAEKSEGEAKAVKVVSSGNGTQNNTFNFYDVGKKSLEELMNEFVPEFKKVCQNMG